MGVQAMSIDWSHLRGPQKETHVSKTHTPANTLLSPFEVPEAETSDFGNWLHLNGVEQAVRETARRLAVLQRTLPGETHWMIDLARDLRRQQQELRRIERDIGEGIKIF